MSEQGKIILLDGPMGTELSLRGIDTPVPGWSAHALCAAPEIVAEIHRDYVLAGAAVHTTATFRTRANSIGSNWEELARMAVNIARESVPKEHLVAGSVAPYRDCYSPDLAPGTRMARRVHRELCEVLADSGVDILLCETFCTAKEGLIAVECALETGKETWAAFTPGPDGSLMTPRVLALAGQESAAAGVSAVFVNCVAASRALDYVEALVRALEGMNARVGVYANAGEFNEGVGWGAGPQGAMEYAGFASEWVRSGAKIVGGCCGTGPGHISEMRRMLNRNNCLATV